MQLIKKYGEHVFVNEHSLPSPAPLPDVPLTPLEQGMAVHDLSCPPPPLITVNAITSLVCLMIIRSDIMVIRHIC